MRIALAMMLAALTCSQQTHTIGPGYITYVTYMAQWLYPDLFADLGPYSIHQHLAVPWYGDAGQGSLCIRQVSQIFSRSVVPVLPASVLIGRFHKLSLLPCLDCIAHRTRCAHKDVDAKLLKHRNSLRSKPPTEHDMSTGL